MSTLVQWIHLTAAVLGIGGIGFLLLALMPSLGVLSPEQRDALARAVLRKFRWVSWSAIILLLASGIYNVRQYYWEVAWGRSWEILTAKIVLALIVFAISLALTIPLGILKRFRERRRFWLAMAFALGAVVILLSAFLRRS
jgi:uncharacterized membrane protein